MANHELTRWFLRVFVVSILATALVGVFALTWPGEIDWLEIKILLTTLIVACASLCGLACGGCLVRGHTILPTAGLVLTGISSVLLLLGLWIEIESELFWKLTFSFSTFAVACAHLSMLFMASLAGGYRWTYILAFQLIFGLAATLSIGAFFEFFEGNDRYWRLIGVLSILVAAITLLIPIFHYLSRDVIAAARAEADPLFAVEEDIARTKKRLIELENKRRILLGRETAGLPVGAGDGPAR